MRYLRVFINQLGDYVEIQYISHDMPQKGHYIQLSTSQQEEIKKTNKPIEIHLNDPQEVVMVIHTPHSTIITI